MNICKKLEFLVLSLLMGCASMQYRADLGKYQDSVWDKTQPEFSVILNYLIEHHDMARSFLSANKPEVLAVFSEYGYGQTDFAIMTFSSEIGKGYIFRPDGSGRAVGALSYYSNRLEGEGIKRQKEFNRQRRVIELKRQYEAEEDDIRHPRKISLEELIGIGFDTEIVNRMQDSGIWPDSDNILGKHYNFRDSYKDGTIPGLKPITEDFRIFSISCNTNLQFNHVFMTARVKMDELDRFITSILHTVQAKLHTSEKASRWTLSSGKTDYTWPYFELADGRRISVSISYSYVLSGYSVYFSVHDVTEQFKRAQQEMYEFRKKDEAEKKRKDETKKLKIAIDGPMSVLFNKVRSCLAVVKSDKGVGSAFVARDGEGVYLFTNEHVVRGGKKPIVTDVDGNEITLGDFELAQERDLVRFKVDGARIGLPLKKGLIEINNAVIVFGNSDGANVITALGGKVIGVGPSLLEVSAEFVEGNSGSPVLTLDGEVVGVATFAVNSAEDKNWVKKDTRFNGVRRFALRIDNVNWKKMDWELYSNIINR